nr:hypothetical protein [Tanacetum cinerariifolium]
ARGESRQVHHRLMRGDEHLGNCRGVNVIQLSRNGHRHAVVDACQLGIRAAAHDAHHPCAHFEAFDVAAFFDNLASDFQADDRGVAKVGVPVTAGAVGQVGAIDAGGIDAHQQVGRAHFRRGCVAQLEHVGVAKLMDDDGFHGCCSDPLRVALAMAEAVMAAGKPA